MINLKFLIMNYPYCLNPIKEEKFLPRKNGILFEELRFLTTWKRKFMEKMKFH